MLTRDHAIAEYDFSRGQILPDRLTRHRDGQYLSVAEKLLNLYRNGTGLVRRQLHQRAEQIFESIPDCPSRRISAFIKLLDDVSEFETDRGRKAAKLRATVFKAAATHHPLVQGADPFFGANEETIKQKIAAELEMSWAEIERKLFSDVIEFHPLKSFDGYPDATALLARYNVAQVQACLYRAERMTIRASVDLKKIVQAIKLSRLMHTITRRPNGDYQFVIDGPTSSIRSTRRYGVAMARMIPMLLTCRNWALTAPIQIGSAGHRLSLQLTDRDGLTSPGKLAPEFDSGLEADLMEKWNKASPAGWELERETEILHIDQKVFLPDFVAQHKSGRQIFVEIVGFWTPEYLQSKIKTLAMFSEHPVLIVAQENKKQALSNLPDLLRENILWYKTTIPINNLVSALEHQLSIE